MQGTLNYLFMRYVTVKLSAVLSNELSTMLIYDSRVVVPIQWSIP